MAVDLAMPILVVDDYNTMVRIIRNLLRQLGFEDIDDATDGAAALAKLRTKKYGLVISDWNMEPMTGYDLLKEVRADPALGKTPFIMVTAESKTENVIAAKKAGVDNYIVKPFNAQTLQAQDRGGVPRRTMPPARASELTTPAGASPLSERRRPRRRCRRAPPRFGLSRPPSSSAWMPAVTNRQSIPNAAAPLRSVRTESPIASTRARRRPRRRAAFRAVASACS